MSLKFALQTLFFVTLSSVLIPAQVYSADKAAMEQKSKDLFDAIVKGNAKGVEELLAACKDGIEKYALLTMIESAKLQNNPLHVAALFGHWDVAKALLAACPEDEKFELLQKQDTNGDTPLHLAAQSHWGKADVVEALLAACKNDKEKYALLQKKDKKDSTPLDLAAFLDKADVVEALLAACPADKKSDLLTMKDKRDQTSLHRAAYWGKTGVVNALLAACPEDQKYKLLTMTNTDGDTPLHLAAFKGYTEVVKALLTACPIQAYSYFQQLGLLQNAEVSKLFTPREKITLILPAMGVVGGSVIGVAIVGYLGYRYFKKKPLPSTIKTITQSQKTSQILRAKGTVAPQKTLKVFVEGRWGIERTYRSIKICWAKLQPSIEIFFLIASSIQLFRMGGLL